MPDDDMEARLRAARADTAGGIHSTGDGAEAIRAVSAGGAGADARTPGRFRRVLPQVLAAAAVVAAVAGVTVAARGTGGDGDTVPAATQPTTVLATGVPDAGTTRGSPTSGTSHPSTNAAGLPPVCLAIQVKLSYHAMHSSRSSGIIALVNTADTACRLNGSISVVPLDANGGVIAASPGWSNTSSPHGMVLSGNDEVPSAGGEPRPGIGWAELTLSRRISRDGGTCPKSDIVTPTAWRVSGSVDGTVPNEDPDEVRTEALVGGPLHACDTGDGLELAPVRLQVVHQAPAPPTRSGGAAPSGGSITNVTPPRNSAPAAPPTATCRRGDLGARYAGGGNGGQSHIGYIVVWNTGPHACTLRGMPTLAATYAGGSPDTAVESLGRTAVSVTLPARMAPFLDRTSDMNKYLAAIISGPVTDASGGACEGSNPGTAPARFVLTIGAVSLSVANHDPDAVQNQVLHGCGGRVVLSPVRAPTGR